MSERDLIQEEAAMLSSGEKAYRFAAMTTAFVSGMGVEIASKSAEFNGLIDRDRLPEPFDFVDHVGNATEAGIFTAFTFTLFSMIASRTRETYMTPGAYKKIAVASVVASAAIQFAAEKYGIGMGGPNTGDMVDAVYGSAFSVVPAFICYAGFNRANRLSIRRGNIMGLNDKEGNIYSREEVATTNPVNSNPHKAKASPQARKKKRKQQKASKKKNRR